MNVKEILGRFLTDSKRIFRVSKKPSLEEYKKMALIIALGIAIIGILGYIITLIFALI
jgi:protein transport protein SEC61 subunit gamma and related proteins